MVVDMIEFRSVSFGGENSISAGVSGDGDRR
jgi:hypothetical protein